MAMLNKDSLFNRVIVQKVTLSNGDAVHILPLPASEVIGGGEVKMEKLIHRSLCDAQGDPFFPAVPCPGEVEDDPVRLLSLPLPDFSILSKAILELNGMKAMEGATEQAEKN